MESGKNEFSTAIEKVYRDALKQADEIIARANEIKREAETELEKARDEKRQIEQNAEIIGDEFLQKRRHQYEEAARLDLLRTLTRKHLEAGASTDEIMRWLDVTPALISQISQVIDRVRRLREAARPAYLQNSVLQYTDEGRSGKILFNSGAVVFSMWWEIAGEDAIAIVGIPATDQWEKVTGLSVEERDAVLDFIGEQIIRDQLFGKGVFVVGEGVMTFYK